MSEARIIARLKKATGIPTVYRFTVTMSPARPGECPRPSGVFAIAKDALGEEMPVWGYDLIELWPDRVPAWVYRTLDALTKTTANTRKA